MIKYIEGDLLEIDVEVLCHQVNAKGVMGSGVALQIKNKYPNVFNEYQEFCKTVEKSEDLLGNCQIVKVDDNKYVANIFAQDNYYPRTIKHTNYTALEQGFIFLKDWMIANKVKTCGIPDMIGCGLAGGNRDVVIEILRNIFGEDKNIELSIVNFNKQNYV